MTAVREGSTPGTTYRFTVNGELRELSLPGMRRLLDVLREDLRPDRHERGLRRG